MTTEVTVLFFARAKDLVNSPSATLHLTSPDHTAISLRGAILAAHPQLAELGNTFVLAIG